MSLSSWLQGIEKLAPIIFPLIPGFPTQLTPYVVQGIQTAEQFKGKTGAEKLALAVGSVNNGIAAINAVKPGSVNAEAVNAAVINGINTVIAIQNVKGQPAAAPEPKA